VTTTELLNTLISRAEPDGLPELTELLASSVSADDAPDVPLTVGEAAALLGMSAHTLRYYERIGLVEVARSGSGQRRYDRALVRRIGQIADQAGATPGQVALAWLLARGDDVVPIPGTKRRAYLAENLGAAGVQLTAGQLDELSALRPAGARYPDMTWVKGESAAMR
jgi:MerR family regulatory protein/Aldo/keto reductase family